MTPGLMALFNSLDTESSLRKLAIDRREEDLYLELKEKENRTTGTIGDGDRESFSKAVAGFANADGGVLIFGVRTKRIDGVDRAHKLKPILDAETFRGRLMDSLFSATQPYVDGVRIELIPATNGGGSYLRCLIPASDKPPHRAMHAGREYWVRTSTGFRRMEHFELEDVFGRRRRPALKIRMLLREDPSRQHDQLHFAILNEGRVVARHAGFVCRLLQGDIIGISGARLEDATRINEGLSTLQFYDPINVVHPNGIFSALGHAHIQRPSRGRPLPLHITWYAEDMARRSESLEVPYEPDGVLIPKG